MPRDGAPDADDDALTPLDRSLRRLTKELANVSSFAHRTQRNTRLLALSLAIDILVTFAIGFTAHQAQDASTKASRATSEAELGCQSTNSARALERQLWGYVLSLPSTRPTTPAQQQETIQFRAFVDRTFAPRDCNHGGS